MNKKEKKLHLQRNEKMDMEVMTIATDQSLTCPPIFFSELKKMVQIKININKNHLPFLGFACLTFIPW